MDADAKNVGRAEQGSQPGKRGSYLDRMLDLRPALGSNENLSGGQLKND